MISTITTFCQLKITAVSCTISRSCYRRSVLRCNGVTLQSPGQISSRWARRRCSVVTRARKIRGIILEQETTRERA